MRAKRLELLRGSIEEILAAENTEALERFRVVVESLCEEHDPFEVAAAALKLAQENEGADDDDTDIPTFTDRQRTRQEKRGERTRSDRTGDPEPGMTRIFIGAGRFAGIRPGDIVGAIANEAGISSKAIGAIEISDRFTLAEVESETAETVVAALQDARFKGRTVTVKLDGGQPQRKGRSNSDSFPQKREEKRFDGERSVRKDRSDRADRSERFERFDAAERRPRGERRGPRR